MRKKGAIFKASRRSFLKRMGAGTAGIALAGTGVGAFFKPSDAGGAYSPYFARTNESLKRQGIGRPCIFVDLDRVDHNLAMVAKKLASPLSYRIAAKSIPSLELIHYVMNKANTNRIMAFHQPYLSGLLELSDSPDILLGKPLLISSVRAFFRELPAVEHRNASRSIQWLVDSEERLVRYLALARELGLKLRINIEIDVGLRRGGLKTNDELGRLLSIIHQNTERLEFTGFMGYEAHVPYAPPVISSVEKAFDQAMAEYRRFHDFGRRAFPGLFAGAMTYNSGGSKTYRMFPGDLPVNDIAAGSAVVKPSTFEILENHKPALFIAAPVIKKRKGVQLPFLDFAAEPIRWWDPNMAQSIYLYGGGWAAETVAPPGVAMNGLTADPPNQNLLPNQSVMNGSSRTPVHVGDFIFFQPHQGDAMFQFQEILVMRDQKIIDQWRPFPRRY